MSEIIINKLLELLNYECVEENYKILDFSDILSAISDLNDEMLLKVITYLEENNYIDLKYVDEAGSELCVAILNKGRIKAQDYKKQQEFKIKQEEEYRKQQDILLSQLNTSKNDKAVKDKSVKGSVNKKTTDKKADNTTNIKEEYQNINNQALPYEGANSLIDNAISSDKGVILSNSKVILTDNNTFITNNHSIKSIIGLVAFVSALLGTAIGSIITAIILLFVLG